MNMKQIITIISLFISLISFSQINLTYEEVQQKFGIENISESQTAENHFEVKKQNESETIKFNYNTENIVIIIEIESKQSIDNHRFHKLVKELNPKFKLTSSGETETINFYYDSKNKLLNIKVYKTSKKSELNKVIFISDTEIISKLIPDIKKWK